MKVIKVLEYSWYGYSVLSVWGQRSCVVCVPQRSGRCRSLTWRWRVKSRLTLWRMKCCSGGGSRLTPSPWLRTRPSIIGAWRETLSQSRCSIVTPASRDARLSTTERTSSRSGSCSSGYQRRWELCVWERVCVFERESVCVCTGLYILVGT